MDRVRQVLRYHHYSYKTEQTYCDWIFRFVKYHGAQKHPKDMGKSQTEAFLSHLATNRKVAASTQRQAGRENLFKSQKTTLLENIQNRASPACPLE